MAGLKELIDMESIEDQPTSSVPKNKSDYTDYTILRLWLDIFDYNKLKTNADIDTFLEIYRLMEMSLKTQKN